MVKTQIETFLRIKPKNDNSIDYSLKDNFIDIKVPENQRKGYVNNLKKSHDFKFSGLFDQETEQETIYRTIGNKVIKKLAFYNIVLLKVIIILYSVMGKQVQGKRIQCAGLKYGTIEV